MRVDSVESEGLLLGITREELGVIRGCALHVFYDFAMGSDYDIATSTGWEKPQAEAFFLRIKAIEKPEPSQESTQFFTFEEIVYLIKIIADTVTEIGAEFQTLTGYFPEEALQVGENLAKLLEGVRG